MLISLTVKNWMSFKDETKWVLVASKERIHRDRIPKKGRLAVSPIAAIFGPNGSGKTNLIEAIKLLQVMVIKRGETTHGVIPYAFSENNEPTTIELEMLINDRIYCYTVSMTKERIINEELSEIRSNKPICLFRREVASDLTQKYHFPNLKCDERLEKFRLIGKKTETNKLFLNLCFDQTGRSVIDKTLGGWIWEYDDIIEWFKMLFVLNPNSLQRMLGFPYPVKLDVLYGGKIWDMIDDPTKSKKLAQWLYSLDTGIIRLDIGPNQFGHKELMTIYRDHTGGEVRLSADQLSSGTIELIRFLIILMQLRDKKIVLVIDDFGQNFHNDLFNAVVELFLSHCGPKTRSQFIFSTHNQSVMTQFLLRLDEMWVVEKHGNHSTLYSFVEFEGLSARTDVAKRYRQGHLGGLPTLYQQQP